MTGPHRGTAGRGEWMEKGALRRLRSHVWSAYCRAFAEAMIARPKQPRIRFACEASSIEELRMLQRVFARVRFEVPPPEIR